MINVDIRPESAKNDELLGMLKCVTTNIINYLINHGVDVSIVSITIWIKEYNEKFFPKIEFGSANQEIQYEISLDGQTIKETHFKLFLGNRHSAKRIDITKNELSPILRTIDDILRPQVPPTE